MLDASTLDTKWRLATDAKKPMKFKQVLVCGSRHGYYIAYWDGISFIKKDGSPIKNARAWCYFHECKI